MIFDAKLNSDNDLDFSKSNLVTGLEKVRQQVKVRLRLFLGEWDYNQNIGMPYFQEILGQRNPDIPKIFSLFLNEIETIPDVKSATIQDFDFNNQTKQLIIKFSVSSNFGDMLFSNSIL